MEFISVSSAFRLGWNEQVWRIMEEEREGNKDCVWSTRVASCLGTPALPSPCLLQGAGVELDPGGEGETEKTGEEKRSSSPLRPWQTGNTVSETSPLAFRHTQNTDARFLFPPSSLSLIFSKARANTHIPRRSALLLLSALGGGGYVCLEHLYPSLAPSLTDYIMSHTTSTQFISLWLWILHLGKHHKPCRLPSWTLCKTTRAALKML